MKSLVISKAANLPVTLKLIPRSQYMDAPKCENPLDQNSRARFFKLLRRKSPTSNTRSNGGQRKYSAAAWLDFDTEITGTISLLITFEDAYGEQHVLVDQAELRKAKSAMLSGQALLDIQGDLDSLKVECLGLPKDTRCWVDDVHIQKITTKKAMAANAF